MSLNTPSLFWYVVVLWIYENVVKYKPNQKTIKNNVNRETAVLT